MTQCFFYGFISLGQGWRSRSGRPGNCWTNVFTEMMLTYIARTNCRVYMKLPMPMDTNLHVYGREANSVTMPRLKGRLQGDVLGPKKAQKPSQSNKFSKKISWESMPPAPRPTSLIRRIRVQVWTNAILLPTGLRSCEYARSTPPYFPCK